MRHRGISAGMIGLVIAAFRLSAIVGQVFWGNICDRYQTNRKVFIITSTLILIFSMLLFLASANWQFYAAAILLGFCQNSTATNMDTWLLKYYNGSQAVYGPALAIGSLGYGIFIFFYGKWIADYGFGIVPYFLIFFTCISILNAAFIPEAPIDSTVKKVKMNRSDMKILFKNSEFVFLLIILFFVGLTIMGMSQIKPMIWEHMDAGVVYHGYDLSAGIVLQVPVFFMATRFSRISAQKRLAVAVFLYLASVSMTIMATHPLMVVLATTIAGTGYGFILPSMREIVRKTAPEQMATTAQGLGDAMFLSVSGMTGAIISGLAIDIIGFKTLLIVFWFMQTLLFVFVLYKLSAKPGGNDRKGNVAL